MAKAIALRKARSRIGAHRRRPSTTGRPHAVQAATTPASHAFVAEENRNAKPADVGLFWNEESTSLPKAETSQPQPSAMLYLRPLKRMGPVLQLQAFDADYLEALREGDPRTQEHFVCYFTELLQLKLRSRLRSPQAIEDVRQETFVRVLATIRKKDGLRQPERLGPFVNTVCNNVLLEHYRRSARSDSLDDEGAPELHDQRATALDAVASRQMEQQVREVLGALPEHDRSLLSAVFIDERDREEVCREFGVDRDYLRVLLHRSKHIFKTAYLKRSGNRLPFTSAPGAA